MTVLTTALRSLRQPAKYWSLLISPAPYDGGYLRKSRPNRALECGLRLISHKDLKGVARMQKFFINTTSSINVAKGRPKPRRSMRSKWVSVVEKEPGTRALQTALINLLQRFPHYDLQTKESVETAIHDIEAKLDPVAIFEEMREPE